MENKDDYLRLLRKDMSECPKLKREYQHLINILTFGNLYDIMGFERKVVELSNRKQKLCSKNIITK